MKTRTIEVSHKVFTLGSTSPISIGNAERDFTAVGSLSTARGNSIYHTNAINLKGEREVNVAYNISRPVNYQGSKIINLCLSGVYLLFFKDEIVYIGQSINPNGRIGSHIRDKIFDGYRILPTNRRLYWEKILIKKYKPKYNGTRDH